MRHLPIHAAGIQGRRTDETVVDRVISSYTTSAKSLVHNRRQRIQNASSVKESRQALLIAMTETTHQTSLPFATEEVTIIRSFLQMGMVAAEGFEQTDEVYEKYLDPSNNALCRPWNVTSFRYCQQLLADKRLGDKPVDCGKAP